MYDVVSLGELLIDFSPSDLSTESNELFEKNPGGAPANVVALLSKLGRKTAFIGKVGRDQFGMFLENTLKSYEVDTTGLVFSEEVNTTLAFVHLDDKGDRAFSFYRNPGADMMLSEDEIMYSMIRKAKIFHFGSVSMTHEPSRTATMKAVKYARKNGVFVSYDPNLRILLWSSAEKAKRTISEGLHYSDLLKISEEELVFLTEEKDLQAGTKLIREKFGIDLILVTLGKRGCFYRLRDFTGQVPTYDVRTIDTTGAGDAFLGAMLYKIVENGVDLTRLTAPDVELFVDFANAAGAMATVKKGAIPAMPSLDEVNKCLDNVRKLIV